MKPQALGDSMLALYIVPFNRSRTNHFHIFSKLSKTLASQFSYMSHVNIVSILQVLYQFIRMTLSISQASRTPYMDNDISVLQLITHHTIFELTHDEDTYKILEHLPGFGKKFSKAYVKSLNSFLVGFILLEK